ncbi:hypothetical protein TrST_g8408 [Triparma strigata]|uniref:Cullin N-terminal domain-containing protein n=1 Tax=Triparma strigata TaxID=1606541 RepID=A0A9W7BVI1_9STRA|nr:hypothetical protein TrST_g8408 [Triparma strigata]
MSSASSFGGRGSSNVGSSSSAKKKFVIKPYRSAPQGDRASALETCFEELYRSAYNLILHKHGEVLYTGVQSCVESHLASVGETVSKSPDASVMKNVSAAWEDHDLKMTMVRDSICMYMDRTYVKQQKKKPIHEVGLQAFREKIWERKDIRGRVERVLLGEVAREREGELVEKDIIRSVLGTKEFYRRESQEYLTKNSAPDYVRKAEERLLYERNRIANYLHLTTSPKLMGIVENELITTHARALVEMDNSGVVTMLENDKVTELMNLFKLVPSTVDILRDAVCDHVKRKGKQLVQDQERVKDPVKRSIFNLGCAFCRDRV